MSSTLKLIILSNLASVLVMERPVSQRKDGMHVPPTRCNPLRGIPVAPVRIPDRMTMDIVEKRPRIHWKFKAAGSGGASGSPIEQRWIVLLAIERKNLILT
jgi:hypothetical protein